MYPLPLFYINRFNFQIPPAFIFVFLILSIFLFNMHIIHLVSGLKYQTAPFRDPLYQITRLYGFFFIDNRLFRFLLPVCEKPEQADCRQNQSTHSICHLPIPVCRFFHSSSPFFHAPYLRSYSSPVILKTTVADRLAGRLLSSGSRMTL